MFQTVQTHPSLQPRSALPPPHQDLALQTEAILPLSLSEGLSRLGYSGFRPHQEEICKAVLQKRNLLVVMPTGSGKSLTYQLPGVILAEQGPTLVISPLLSLIEDQIAKLRARGIPSGGIHSGMTRDEQRESLKKYLRGEMTFLFLAPERLGVPGFMECLSRRAPALIAIDEAHCISKWGHDFRGEYRLIGERLSPLRSTPIIALTATATEQVQDDICTQLAFQNEVRSVFGFRRTNLEIQVLKCKSLDRIEVIRSLLREPGSTPAIIYASTRKSCEGIYEDLQEEFQTTLYHAGLEASARQENQKAFLDGQTKVVVATVAFGMGIDKADIRSVIHAGIPSSVESYYQEIGRAGRDGKLSKATLLFSETDQKTHEFLFERNYPEPSLLRQFHKEISEEWTPVESYLPSLQRLLKESVASSAGTSSGSAASSPSSSFLSRPEETLKLFLEKLEIHQGIESQFKRLVKKSATPWEKSYSLQRKSRMNQLRQTLTFVYQGGCRMVALLKYFGDVNDSTEPCTHCDRCRPTRIKPLKRALDLKEREAIFHMTTILRIEGSRSMGALFREVSETLPSFQRSQGEELLSTMEAKGWIEKKTQRFEKDGEWIEFKRISLTPSGRSLTRKTLEQATLSIHLTSPSKSKSPKH